MPFLCFRTCTSLPLTFQKLMAGSLRGFENRLKGQCGPLLYGFQFTVPSEILQNLEVYVGSENY